MDDALSLRVNILSMEVDFGVVEVADSGAEAQWRVASIQEDHVCSAILHWRRSCRPSTTQ